MPLSASDLPFWDEAAPDRPILPRTDPAMHARSCHTEAAAKVPDPDPEKSAYKKTAFSPAKYRTLSAPVLYSATALSRKKDHFSDARILKYDLPPKMPSYIPLFQNVGIRLDLIKQQFCRKNHTECSDFLEKWYYDLKRENALNKAIENTLDNAFAKIQDKRKIAFYLQLIEKADQFPLVMTMLGKWNIENAKPIIINRLEIDRIKTNAIRALGYYKDKSTVPLIEKYVDSEYSGVRKEAKKVLSILL